MAVTASFCLKGNISFHTIGSGNINMITSVALFSAAVAILPALAFGQLPLIVLSQK